jgi:outer membrane protein assembly factor BamB
VECQPPDAEEQICLFQLNELGLVIEPGGSTEFNLVLTARDRVAHESSLTRKLTIGTRLQWHTYAGSPIEWPVVVAPDGRILVATNAGSVTVVDSTGTQGCSWTAPTVSGLPDAVAAPMTLTSDGARLFVATVNRLYSINPFTCEQQWSAGGGGGPYFNSQPAHDPNNNVVYIGSYGTQTDNGRLQAITANSGQQLGTFNIAGLDKSVTSSPALSADYNTVYIGSVENQVFAVDVTSPGSMQQRWVANTAGPVETRPLVLPSRIYITGLEKTIRALDPTTGLDVPGFSFQAEAGFKSSPVTSPDGTLYAGSLDETLYAIDTSGKTIASYVTGRMINSQPAIGPGGMVYAVRTKPGRLYTLTPDLKLRWSVDAGLTQADQSEFKGSPVVHGNMVYIGSSNGYLFALDASESGL